jgi:hypothetical protein
MHLNLDRSCDSQRARSIRLLHKCVLPDDLELNDPALQSDRDSMCSIAGAELRENVGNPALDGRLGDKQAIGELSQPGEWLTLSAQHETALCRSSGEKHGGKSIRQRVLVDTLA